MSRSPIKNCLVFFTEQQLSIVVVDCTVSFLASVYFHMISLS